MAIRNHLGIISLLFFLVVVFYSDVFLHPGYVLTPASDIYGQYSVWNAILRHLLLTVHTFPFWNIYEFGGSPFLANPLLGIFYPPNIVYLLISSDAVFGFMFAFDTLLIGIFTYFFATQLMKGRTGPLIAAISFMLSGSVIGRVYAGHIANVNVMVWVVASFFILENYFQRKKSISLLLLGLTIALTVFAGHLQVAFYGLFILVVYSTIRIIVDYSVSKKIREGLLTMIKIFSAFIVGLLLSAIQILPTLEFGMHTIRSGGVSFEFASSYSIPFFQMASIIMPNIFGSPAVTAWWGRGNFWEFSMYIGVIPIILACISFLRPNKFVVILTVIAIFTLLFSLGSYGPIFWLFYRFIPGFNMFRIPATMLYLTSFMLSILAGFGTIAFFDAIKKKTILDIKAIIFIPFFVFLVSSLLFTNILLHKGVVIFFYSKYLSKFNAHASGLFYDALLRDIGVISVGSLLLPVIVLLKNRFKNKTHLKAMVVAFIFLDLIFFGKRFIKTAPPTQDKLQLETFVANNAKDAKVFDLGTGIAPSLQKLFIRNATGYNPNYLSSYRNYLWQIGDHLNLPYEPFVVLNDIKNTNLLRMLGVKYVITGHPITNDSLTQVFKSKEGLVYLLKDQMPDAYVIHNATLVSNNKTALLTISRKTFDEKNELVLERAPDLPLHNSGQYQSAKVTVSDNTVKASITSVNPGFFVMREIWYPGWIAYVNDIQVPIYRANAIFRAVPIAKGINKVRLVYIPTTFEVGFIISAVSFLGLLVCLIYNSEMQKIIRKRVFLRR